MARGVTIENLLVTYYGRQAKRTNMDTMLQHARMYGYRQDDIDVMRLFVTSDVEQRFRVINDSEDALRSVIEQYPNESYRGIILPRSINATRSNVLNPYNVGAYVAGRTYFPQRPLSVGRDVEGRREKIDEILARLHPQDGGAATPTTVSQLLELVKLTESDPEAGGLWNDTRIVAAMETLKDDERYGDVGYLVVRRNRDVRPHSEGKILRAVLGGGEPALAVNDYPTLFMYRLTGRGWDGIPFWVPVVRFPDGQYAVIFNFE